MWRWYTLFLYLFVVIVHSSGLGSSENAEDGVSRVVRTAHGTVRGHKDPDTGVFAFYDIPYATVPTGKHKFQAPLPAPVWLQTLDAVNRGIVCPQPITPFISVVKKLVQDDCLVTSVYAPDTEETKLPVIVYIHGGAFQIGYGNMVPPTSFVKDRKFIAVTFNYRLGVNGFLCLGTTDTPGNAGLKDQLALLRWVQRNIASFGGNPDDVTIAGGSAGSVSADLLRLSKQTNGLFKKVILESGASAGVIAIQTEPLEIAKKFARKFGFTDVDDIYALEKFYKDAPTDMFTQDLSFDNPNSNFGFTPCVERDTGKDVFLHDAPVSILKKGKYRKVPVLFGFDNMEGLFHIQRFGTWKTKMNEKFSDFLPADLQFESDAQKEEVAKLVKEFFFGDKPIDETNVLKYIDYFTDVLFGYPTLRTVKLQVEQGHDEIYLYEFSFVDENTPIVPHTNVRGANHCDQTMMVLDALNFVNPIQVNASEEYKKMQAVVQEMWYNFIVTGKPVPEGSSLPEWPAVGEDRSPHMSLGKAAQLQGPLLQGRARFWDDIYSKYYRAPLPPPTPPHSEL